MSENRSIRTISSAVNQAVNIAACGKTDKN